MVKSILPIFRLNTYFSNQLRARKGRGHRIKELFSGGIGGEMEFLPCGA
jgi:hypothetical protein